MCLAQEHNTVTLEPAALRSRVKQSTNEPLCSRVSVCVYASVYGGKEGLNWPEEPFQRSLKFSLAAISHGPLEEWKPKSITITAWHCIPLCLLGNFASFFIVCWYFFKINFWEKFFQEYHQSVKKFGSRSGPMFCQSWSVCKCYQQTILIYYLFMRAACW